VAVKKILLFYISVNSGHQMAALAIEDSIRMLNQRVDTLNINHFHYTNPVLAQLIMKTYHGMLKRTPELWEYVYDNDRVRNRTAKFRDLIHKLDSKKLQRLIEWYQPDIIVCTQAFPCVSIAEYKRQCQKDIPVVGVVTDYGIHSYWVDPDVDLYVVPNIASQERLKGLGVEKNRIEVKGIPVSPRFSLPLDKKKLRYKFGITNKGSVVLVMGGSRGMISMDEIVKYLVKLPLSIHLLVVCGANRQLYKRMQTIKKRLKARMNIYGFVNNIEELMSVADVLVTKPGGLTITESLVKRLPMVIINPIAGQEAKNSSYLIKNKTALQAADARDVARRVGDLAGNPEVLEQVRNNISAIMKPNAAREIADRIINWDNGSN